MADRPLPQGRKAEAPAEARGYGRGVSSITADRADLRLQDEVAAEIGWDPRFTPGEVGVEVDQGVVTLRGTVSSYQKLVTAGGIAAGVAGVKAVANDLVVQPPERAERDDTSIARAVRWALQWDADVPDERIECIVREGTVTLRGTVEHAYQRSAAVGAASRLIGVRRVVDEVAVERTQRGDADICADLKAELQPRMPWANMVGFRSRGGLVVLSGFVRTAEERLAAEKVAWEVPGVRHVLNSIALIKA